jgi:hypothetical protein
MLQEALSLGVRTAALALRPVSGAVDLAGDAALAVLDAVLASPRSDEAIDRILASPLAEQTMARALSPGGLGEQLVQRLLDGPELERMVALTLDSPQVEAALVSALEGPATERLLERALESPGMERLIARVLESRLIEETVARLVDDTAARLPESQALWTLVDEVAQSPAVTDAITQQGLGLADEVAGDVRDRSRVADAWLERIAHRVLHRARGSAPPPAAPEPQRP